jgi:hypothetical protein
MMIFRLLASVLGDRRLNDSKSKADTLRVCQSANRS